MSSARPVLIAESDTTFLRRIHRHPMAQSAPPVIARTGREALSKLADQRFSFSSLFVSIGIRTPNLFSVIRFAHLKRPGIPIFILFDGNRTGLSDETLQSLAVQALVNRELDYTDIRALIDPLIERSMGGFRADGSYVRVDSSPAGTQLEAADSEYAPILSKNFLAGRKSFFDLFVRLSSGRYIKILRAGDGFEPARLEMYLAKGIKHFHIRREAQAAYLSYCDELSAELMRHSRTPLSVLLSQTMNFGHEIMSFLSQIGVDESRIEMAIRFVHQLDSIVRETHFGSTPILQDFLTDLAHYEHGVATALVATIMAQDFTYRSERFSEIVALAGMFHDIGLKGVLPSEGAFQPEHLNPQEKALYLAHPFRGAEILSRIAGLDPRIADAVAQHHERRTGQGFPARLGPGRISRAAEIVGLADEFVALVSRTKKDVTLDPFEIMERQVFDGFSYQAVNAFRQAFL